MKKMNFIFIASIIALALFTSGCSLSTKKTATPNNSPVPPFLAQNSADVQTRTSTNLTIAKSKAAEWKSDAYFAAYNVKVPADLTSTDPAETFVFGSPSDTANWWTISIDKDGKYIRALIPKEDYLGQDPQPIVESAWQKNYLDALKTAESNGGLTFRGKNPEAQISLILEQTAPNNYLWWVVTYQGATTSLKVRISARDGGVYDEFGNPMSGVPNPTSVPLSSSTP